VSNPQNKRSFVVKFSLSFYEEMSDEVLSTASKGKSFSGVVASTGRFRSARDGNAAEVYA
jgi:hypothetical protein